jgi:nucleoid-associated protein YgaU
MTEQLTTETTETEDDVTGFHHGYYAQPYFYRGAYVVRPGDSLFAIAQRMYGDGRLWPALFVANADQIGNPNLIFPGQVLRVA